MVFIETVIGEVDVGVAEVLFRRLLVILRAKSSQSFLIEIADVRADRRYEDVEPQIEFLVAQEERLIDVRLHYPLLVGCLRDV